MPYAVRVFDLCGTCKKVSGTGNGYTDRCKCGRGQLHQGWNSDLLTEYDEAKHMKLIEKEAEAIGQIKGAVKLARSTPDISDREIVSKIVDLFGLSENEAWEYVRNYD